MAKAKKTPSGSWRVLVFDHDEIVTLPDGSTKKKKIRRSFTCSDPSPAGKREAERMAAEWACNKTGQSAGRMTVLESIEAYLSVKADILSPTTIKGYRTLLRTNYGMISSKPASSLRAAEVQRWIGDLSTRVSPKTVRNTYSLLLASLKMAGFKRSFDITLPMSKKADLYTPSDDDIRVLLAHIEGTTLERAVLLAAFGTLRRGEICALTDEDLDGCRLTVNKSAVRSGGKIVIKSPKTTSSYRVIVLPQFVADKFAGIKGRLVPTHPEDITKRFGEAIKECGLHHFRFHDLRSYSVSIAHAIGIPDQYLMQRGGWKSDRVLKQVYRRTIDQEQKRFDEQINDHFSQLVHSKVHST